MSDIWIQLENRAWDVAPWRIDRMTGLSAAAVATPKLIISPETGASRTVNMWKPLAEDALILRRYTANWAAPDDRKVNPWDRNEPNPTDSGTMGTIPGPVIECQLGETVTVHFRNKDARSGKSIAARTHSLHPHGFVFDPRYDGAYPLSPPDPTQAVGAEAALWTAAGVSGFKRGDRVPPGGTFNYTWQTIGWPTTAGVWLYHDHSVCDMDNVALGAIGIIVIHNPNDPEDLVIGNADLPGGSVVGNVWERRCFPFPFDVRVLPHDLIALGRISSIDQPPGLTTTDSGVMPPGGHGGMGAGMEAIAAVGGFAGMSAGHQPAGGTQPLLVAARGTLARSGVQPASTEFHPLDSDSLSVLRDAHSEQTSPGASGGDKSQEEKCEEPSEVAEHQRAHDVQKHAGEHPEPRLARSFQIGDAVLELNAELTKVARFCPRFYRTPPAKAQYLLLFHHMPGVSMCINGRKYLGNTPTVIAGPQTNMRFGVVGMGNVDGFHTFHLHGHRWTLNGPHGNNRAAIQGSVEDTPVSQFEDTRTFGPANSFAFTIKEGSLGGIPSFMGAPPGAAVGEWHMHCHVLNHMMDGMMGSLLVVNGGEFVTALPVGEPCETDAAPTNTVVVKNTSFTPNALAVAAGTVVTFDFQEVDHTVMNVSAVNASPFNISANHPPGAFNPVDAVPAGSQRSVTIVGSPGGMIKYQCGIHGAFMSGSIAII